MCKDLIAIGIALIMTLYLASVVATYLHDNVLNKLEVALALPPR